jgi:hypothetical protein
MARPRFALDRLTQDQERLSGRVDPRASILGSLAALNVFRLVPAGRNIAKILEASPGGAGPPRWDSITVLTSRTLPEIQNAYKRLSQAIPSKNFMPSIRRAIKGASGLPDTKV